MNNDNVFLVVEVKENGQVVLAAKAKTVTMDLSMYGQQVAKGQFIRLDEGVLQQISEPSGVEVNNGKLSVRTKIVGAYDGQDEKCKGLVKTEFFLKVARGTLAPVENDNELIGQVVTIGFNADQQCWEVVTVHAKPVHPRHTTGLIYTMSGEQSVRLYAPGWPVDFELDCGSRDRASLLGQWFEFAIPGDFKTLKWRDVKATEPGVHTKRDGDVVMLHLFCKFDEDSRSLRTVQNELVIDPYGSLTRFFEESEDDVQSAILELCPLNNGSRRLMSHLKKKLIVGEKGAGGFSQRPWFGAAQGPRFDNKAPSGEKVKERSELSKKEVPLINPKEDPKEEFEALSKKIQEQQQLAGQLYLTVTNCSNKIPNVLAQEIYESFIQLTIYESQCDNNSENEVLRKTVVLKEGVKKHEEFFKKANAAILRSGLINIPNAARAFLGNLKKNHK